MCPVCRQRPAEVGVLCEECRDELSSPIKIMPEQIQLHGARPTMAALIDIWGRPHRLDPRTLIGRQVDGQGLAVLEPSVSRHHAHLTLDNDEWTVRDLGSANGTFQDDKLISAPIAMHERDRVRFGHIAFYFVEDVARLPPPRLGRAMTATIPPPAPPPAPPRPAPPPAPGAAGDPRPPPPPAGPAPGGGPPRRRPAGEVVQDARADR